MAVRPIDAVHVLNDINWHHKPTPVSELESGFNQGINQAMWIITHAPTLTPQNEWISVEERLPEPGDLIVYADNTVWGYQYGICRVCGKEKAFDYWIPLQDPPNNRPPEGEEDT